MLLDMTFDENLMKLGQGNRRSHHSLFSFIGIITKHGVRLSVI